MQSTSPLTPWPFSTVKVLLGDAASLWVSSHDPFFRLQCSSASPIFCITEPHCSQAALWWTALCLPSTSFHRPTPKQKSLGAQVTSNYTF